MTLRSLVPETSVSAIPPLRQEGSRRDYPEFTLPASSNYVRSLKRPPGIRFRGLPSLHVRQDREDPR